MNKKQHTTPCKDCPWRRVAAPGWLGALTADDWVQVAHSDSFVECHKATSRQCAGLAIYRANVCKSPRDAKILALPKDKQVIFATPMEFLIHHENPSPRPR